MGYCYILSDVKVSWGNNVEIDCLQKFYPISKNIGAGFAGSVSLGFKMLDALGDYIRKNPSERGIVPEYVANQWGRIARRLYNEASPIEKRLGCHLIMLGISPKRQIEIGTSYFPRTHVLTFYAPYFRPQIISAYEFGSIGSGMVIKEYKELLDWFNNEINNILKFEEFGQFGMSTILNILVTDKLSQFPKFGISNHLQIFIGSSGGFTYLTNDRIAEDDSSILKMPELAKGYLEFKEFCKMQGFKASAATT